MANRPKKRRSRQTPQEKLAKAREKGKREAMDLAAECVMYVMLYILKDKRGLSDEELTEHAADYRYVIDSINNGYLTWQDIRDTLKEDYGIVWETK